MALRIAPSTWRWPTARGWRWTIAEASAELAACRLLMADAGARIDPGANAQIAAAQAKLVATRTAERHLPRLAQAMGAEGLRVATRTARAWRP
jgi:alkylation response protein AidB-like acyl-CoA dehydrogenase